MINIEDLIDWLMCSQNIADEKVYEFCGDMGCHGMKCFGCREEAAKEAAAEIKTLLEERKEQVHAHVVSNWLGDCHCSNCGKIIDCTSNFCNWCGARLDEPEQCED